MILFVCVDFLRPSQQRGHVEPDFICVDFLRPSQQRGHVEPVS